MKKILSLGLVLVLCFSMFVGCGEKKPTAKEILNGMNQVQPDSFSCTANMVADADVLISGAPLNFKATMNYDIDAEVTDDAMNMYMNADINVAAVGQKQAMNLEAYYVLDDAESSVYMKSNQLGSGWYKADGSQAGSSAASFETIKSAMTAKKEPVDDKSPLVNSKVTEEEYNGTKCYKLTYEGDFNDLADELFAQLSNSGVSKEQLVQMVKAQTGLDIDLEKALSEIKFTVEIYAAKEDFAPVSVKIDLGNTDLEAILDACGIDLSAYASAMGVQVTGININDLYFQVDFNKIGGVSVEVPADVISNAVMTY